MEQLTKKIRKPKAGPELPLFATQTLAKCPIRIRTVQLERNSRQLFQIWSMQVFGMEPKKVSHVSLECKSHHTEVTTQHSLYLHAGTQREKGGRAFVTTRQHVRNDTGKYDQIILTEIPD